MLSKYAKRGKTVQNISIRGAAIVLLGIYFLLSTIASCLDKFSKSPRDLDIVKERSDLRNRVLSQIKGHAKNILHPDSTAPKKPRHRA